MNNRFFNLIKLFMKETFRNKLDVFFTIFFPVFFLVLFGNIFFNFGETNTEQKILRIGIIGNYEERIEDFFDPHVVSFYDDLDEIRTDVKERKVSLGINIIDNNEVEFYVEENIDQMRDSYYIMSVAENSLKRYFVNADKDFVVTNEQLISLGGENISEIDYLLTGVLSISILSGGMFSIIGVFGRYKKQGIIKRFMSAPAKPWEFVVSSSFSKLMLNIVAVIVIILLATFMFETNYTINWLLFSIVILSSSIGMMGLGILILILFKKTETSYTAASVLFTVMTFFSGIYFPVSFIPENIRWISHALPVTYMVDIIRHSAGVEFMSSMEFGIINLIFVLGGILLLITASKIYVTSERNINV